MSKSTPDSSGLGFWQEVHLAVYDLFIIVQNMHVQYPLFKAYSRASASISVASLRGLLSRAGIVGYTIAALVSSAKLAIKSGSIKAKVHP